MTGLTHSNRNPDVLTPSTLAVLALIMDHRGHPPNVRQIADRIGVSVHRAHVHLKRLKCLGLVTWNESRAHPGCDLPVRAGRLNHSSACLPGRRYLFTFRNASLWLALPVHRVPLPLYSPAVTSLLASLRHWLHWQAGSRFEPEPSRLIVGSTGSGKSEGELVELVRLADRHDYAVILLDGHGPLALRAAGHWAARGHESRIVYEPLNAVDRVLCWNMLPKSAAAGLSQRRIEDRETTDEVAQCFLSQRGEETLSTRPWTKEWLEAAIALCLAQPKPEPLASLLSAFHVGRPDYERLLTGCEDRDIVGKFREMERLRRRTSVQYELQTGPSRRLIELVCSSEVARLRCRPGPFDWLQALQEKKLIAFDGGGIRSRELKRTLFLLASMHVLHAVRRHFAESQQPLPVVLVLEEAGALGLVTPFIVHAQQELRKAGLAVHLITQSTLDFADPTLFESLLAHSPWQGWYQCLAPADQELGGKVLANATFDARSVYFTRIRTLSSSVERTTAAGQGKYRGIFRTRFKHVTDPYYKSPQLHEQEYRTQLATLKVGQRIVRDRLGVRRERVSPVRSPRVPLDLHTFTLAAIERVRQQPIYLPGPPAEQVPSQPLLPDAAERLCQTRQSLPELHDPA